MFEKLDLVPISALAVSFVLTIKNIMLENSKSNHAPNAKNFAFLKSLQISHLRGDA